MYNILDKIIDQPSELNEKVILYYNYVKDKMDGYTETIISNIIFGKEDHGYVNKGNDFHYLLAYLCIIYYDEKTYYEVNGVYRTQEELYDEYDLETKRLYFHKYHQFDIVPLYDIFDIMGISTLTGDDIFCSGSTDVDLDCLI